jgi:hypothetical protein
MSKVVSLALEKFKSVLSGLAGTADPSKTIFNDEFEAKLKTALDAAASELIVSEGKRRDDKLARHKARRDARKAKQADVKAELEPPSVVVAAANIPAATTVAAQLTPSVVMQAIPVTTPHVIPSLVINIEGSKLNVDEILPVKVKRKVGRPCKTVEEKAATVARRLALKKIKNAEAAALAAANNTNVSALAAVLMARAGKLSSMKMESTAGSVSTKRLKTWSDPNTLAGLQEAELEAKLRNADAYPVAHKVKVPSPFDNADDEDDDFAREIGERVRQSTAAHRTTTKAKLPTSGNKGNQATKDRWTYRKTKVYDPDADLKIRAPRSAPVRSVSPETIDVVQRMKILASTPMNQLPAPFSFSFPTPTDQLIMQKIEPHSSDEFNFSNPSLCQQPTSNSVNFDDFQPIQGLQSMMMMMPDDPPLPESLMDELC